MNAPMAWLRCSECGATWSAGHICMPSQSLRHAARARILRFLAEAERRGYGDSLVGFGQLDRDDSDEIRMSDLRLLLDAKEAQT